MAETKKCNCMDLSEEEILENLDKVLDDYAGKPGALIPVLQITQTMFGYLPEAALKRISVRLDKPFSEVAGVVTFYSFFTTKPRGKNLIRVCLGTACYVRGGKEILASVKHELGIDIGETTPDRLFSLEIGRCFGACGLSPVIMINDDIFQRVKPSRISDLLSKYRETEKEQRSEANAKV